jgi:DNA processing protein
MACADCQWRAAPPGALLRTVDLEHLRSRRWVSASAGERAPTALCAHDHGYPQRLTQLNWPPAVLHATCTSERLGELLSKPVIAIVGDHTPSAYAKQMTDELARELGSAGVTLIGGCNDFDAIAHHAALRAGGQTVAVMPLAAEQPHPSHDLHPHIIAALASLVVVVEAPQRSSALFIAHLASELGRDLAVVPGRVTDAGGPGMFGLLRDGAFPVSCANDVLELIPMVHATEHRAQRIAA